MTTSQRKVTRVKVDDTPPLQLVDFLDLDQALEEARAYYLSKLEESQRALINLDDGKVNVRHQYGIYRSRIVRVLKEVER